jgi:hypothetical protein
LKRRGHGRKYICLCDPGHVTGQEAEERSFLLRGMWFGITYADDKERGYGSTEGNDPGRAIPFSHGSRLTKFIWMVHLRKGSGAFCY